MSSSTSTNVRSLLLIAAFLTLWCVPARADVRVVKDLAYKEGGSDYERERCKLDLYLPEEGKKGYPVVVWFHGGGLKGGDKAGKIAATFGRRMAGEGIAVASVNYRLYPKVRYPEYLRDAAAAVAWVHRNGAKHGIDPRKLFVSGHSAGGYLSALVAVDRRYLKAEWLSTSILAGALPISGQMDSHSTVREERGRKTQQIDESAPIYHAHKDAPPMLIFAGKKDLPGRAEINRRFFDELVKRGHEDVALRVVEGRNHGTIASRVGEKDDAVAAAMVRFIRRRSPGR